MGLLLAILELPAEAQTPSVVINEINYATSGTGNPAEFVELYNSGTSAVDLSGWKFDAGVTYTFPATRRNLPHAGDSRRSDRGPASWRMKASSSVCAMPQA